MARFVRGRVFARLWSAIATRFALFSLQMRIEWKALEHDLSGTSGYLGGQICARAILNYARSDSLLAHTRRRTSSPG